MSANVKANIKQQEIKDLVAVSSFDFCWHSIHLDIVCEQQEGGGGDFA